MFARDILEIICKTNESLQEQYIILPEAWGLICRMKDQFSDLYRQMRNGHYDQFDYLCQFDDEQQKTFLNVIENLLLNVDVRFPCPSTSIELRHARPTLDFPTNALNREWQNVRSSCPLFVIDAIFMLPDDFMKRRKINQYFVSGAFPKSFRLSRQLSTMRRQSWMGRTCQTHRMEGERVRWNQSLCWMYFK